MGSAAPSLVHSRRRSPLLLFSFAVLQVCLLDTTAEAMEDIEAMVDTVEAMEGTVVDMEAMVIMAREKQRLLLVRRSYGGYGGGYGGGYSRGYGGGYGHYGKREAEADAEPG